MPIKPRDFLEQSQGLIDSTNEVDHRSAVSRSYYCALHTCIELCKTLPGGFKDHAQTSHQSVIDQLEQWSIEREYVKYRGEAGALARQLRKGRTMRVRADYKLPSQFDKNRAREHLSKMGKVTVQARNLIDRILAPARSKRA